MIKKVKYVSDSFLDDFKTNFEFEYLQMYKDNDFSQLSTYFSNPENVIESDIEFNFQPLRLEKNVNDNFALDNVQILWNSLGHLTPTVASSEKVWIAMENTYYLDYHLNQLEMIDGKNRDQSIRSRTIFSNGRKRSLFINNLALLWWIAYYLIDDDKEENRFHLVEYFLKGVYRGNAISFFSSNFVSNKNLGLGVIEAIKELVEEERMVENRFSYSNSNKILNQLGGVKILDVLTRDEVKAIIKSNLLTMPKIRICE